jgi:DNA-binding transcriptional LysR family regulator
LASQKYLDRNKAPKKPQDLLQHRLLAFAFWNPQNTWTFTRGKARETVTFHPRLAMNDYAGLATALVAGSGIGELPPIVAPHLLQSGKLVEVMPNWRFSEVDVSIVHLGNRHTARPVRLFKEFATQMAPTLFSGLPT